MRTMTENNKLGALKAILSEHLFSKEVENEMDRYPTQAIIGLGQGGGRIAAELSRFGHPTYLLNSSKSDMEEHNQLIPESHRIVTSSEEFPELEGTDKNAQLGYEIAVENKKKYQQVAIADEIQDAEFVWVCVSLGGGTGNGALKVALSYLSRVREARKLPGDKIPLGVICSLPSSDERGSQFRKNALAGISLLQNMVDQNQIGSILVIDNERMNDYYEKSPLKTHGGHQVDAKSYSNMVVSGLIAEISSIPLLSGRSVLDKTELLSTLSTPGWLSISRNNDIKTDSNLSGVIDMLFRNNEVLAEYDSTSAVNAAVAIMYPSSRNIEPRIADDVYKFSSDLLETKVNLSISNNSRVKNLTLYGIAVLPSPPTRIAKLNSELQEWLQIEEERKKAQKEAAASLNLGEFDDFFSTKQDKPQRRRKLSLDDFEESDENNQSAKRFTASSLDDIDF